MDIDLITSDFADEHVNQCTIKKVAITGFVLINLETATFLDFSEAKIFSSR